MSKTSTCRKWTTFSKISLVFIALISLAAWLIYADNTEPPRLLADDFSQISLTQSLQNIADKTVEGGAPGVLILVRKDNVETIATAGVANKASGEKMSARPSLRIASISKVYTATVILSLANQGLIDLDAKITEYLNEKLIGKLPNALDTTVRQLLLHTSGIPDYYDLRSYFLQDWSQPITLRRMLPVSERGMAKFPAGERFEYSNMGYILLGEIAEQVSGNSLGELIDKAIIAPLGFTDTYYNVQHPNQNGIHGYGTLMRPWADTYSLWEHSGPDGGVMAKASEVARFLEALTLQGGLLNDIGQQMRTQVVESGQRKHQGLGLETLTGKNGAVLIGHTGDVFGYQTVAFANRETNSVFVAHINCDCSALSASLIGNISRAIKYSQ